PATNEREKREQHPRPKEGGGGEDGSPHRKDKGPRIRMKVRTMGGCGRGSSPEDQDSACELEGQSKALFFEGAAEWNRAMGKEGRGDRLRIGGSRGRIHRQKFADEISKGFGHVLCQRRQGRLGTRRRPLAREHVVEGGPERVKIRPCISLRPFHLLGRGKPERPEKVPGGGQALKFVDIPGDAEIGDLDGAVVTDQD